MRLGIFAALLGFVATTVVAHYLSGLHRPASKVVSGWALSNPQCDVVSSQVNQSRLLRLSLRLQR